MSYTRREVGKLLLAGVPAAGLLWKSDLVRAQAIKPDSNWAGVQVGLNVPYSFGNNNMSGDETLQRCLQLGISALELRSQPVELFLGSPALEALAARGGTRGGGRGGGRRAGPPTPEELAAQKAADEELVKWRLSVPMSKVAEFRKKYEDAGVLIQIVKFDNYNIYTQPDDVVDYCFELAKALGARAISCEISAPDTKRIGEFAAKHKMMVGYHGHQETAPKDWEEAFASSPYNGANVNLGHFVAGNNTSPIPFITQYHDRITHVHVKDMKMHHGPAVPFGEGDVPIAETLQLIRDKKWNIQATIEFEYKVPDGSDRMTEIAKCVAYCKRSLLA